MWPLLSPVISRRPEGSIVMQEISSVPCASEMCCAWRPVFRSQNVTTDPSQAVITWPMLGLYRAAVRGLQWVVLAFLFALIATILISAKQSLLPIKRELMGEVMRRNGKGPCSGILWPNGNLTGIVWRQTCSLISQAFNTWISIWEWKVMVQTHAAYSKSKNTPVFFESLPHPCHNWRPAPEPRGLLSQW